MTISDALTSLGITLPPVASPAGSYVPARNHGVVVHTSGQLPTVDGTLLRVGTVGDAAEAVSPKDAAACARVAAINAIAAAAAVAGGVDKLTGVLKVTGFVASEPGFGGQPTVINGASDLLGEVFGEAGAHVRSAVGVAALPLGAPVEVEVTFCL